MPGSVQNASPNAVLPRFLCAAFARAQEYPVLETEYRNGESQRSAQASNSRKRWQLAVRLTASQLAALREFYDARHGASESFYFYDPYETNPKFSHDPTGQAIIGRHTVRFDGPWRQFLTLGRLDAALSLVEVA